MTARSWTEFRIYLNEDVVATVVSAKDAAQWAKDARKATKDQNLKYACMEISICEIPKRRFSV